MGRIVLTKKIATVDFLVGGAAKQHGVLIGQHVDKGLSVFADHAFDPAGGDGSKFRRRGGHRANSFGPECAASIDCVNTQDGRSDGYPRALSGAHLVGRQSQTRQRGQA